MLNLGQVTLMRKFQPTSPLNLQTITTTTATHYNEQPRNIVQSQDTLHNEHMNSFSSYSNNDQNSYISQNTISPIEFQMDNGIQLQPFQKSIPTIHSTRSVTQHPQSFLLTSQQSHTSSNDKNHNILEKVHQKRPQTHDQRFQLPGTHNTVFNAPNSTTFQQQPNFLQLADPSSMTFPSTLLQEQQQLQWGQQTLHQSEVQYPPTNYVNPTPRNYLNLYNPVDNGLDTKVENFNTERLDTIPSSHQSLKRSSIIRTTTATTTTTTTKSSPDSKKRDQFVCSKCGKRFSKTYNLKSHSKSHSDEKPFKCTFCSKAFARTHDKKRHEALHQGIKRFQCGGILKDQKTKWGCGKRFSRADGLNRHFKTDVGWVCVRPLMLEAEKSDNVDVDDSVDGFNNNDSRND